MKIKHMLLFCSFPFLIYATPTWMDIGTFALGNGPIGSTPLYLESTANYFFDYACANHPAGPTPSHYITITNNNVIVPTVSGATTSREICDFVWIGTHGNIRNIEVWNATHTGGELMTTSQMAFGTGYTRWVYLGGCHVLHYDNYDSFFSQDSATSWSAAFKGVQCILGWSSAGLPGKKETYQVFWEHWTGNNGNEPSMGMWDAYREAFHEVLYIGLDYDCAPAIVTTHNGAGHWFWDDTYQQATSQRGVSWATGTRWYEYGDPD